MVKIRLARLGRKKGAFYRIVVLDADKKTAGGNLGVLGYWNPLKNELKADKDLIEAWVKKGAQLSPTVKKLLTSK